MASRLSLAARLYSIFGLFALLTAAIAVLSDYNTRRGTELTHAIETANLAALNVERVNSLVYAVVMESRGVYMSTDPTVVKKFGDGLLTFNDHILAVVKKWEGIVQADDAEQFATFRKRIEQFVEFRKELVRRANEISPAAGREWGDNDANRSVRAALNKDLEALSKVYVERGRRIAQQTEENHTLSLVLTGLGGVALLLCVLGVIIIARSIARPLSVITTTIKKVAEERSKSKCRTPAAPTRLARWRGRSRFSRRRWSAIATSRPRSPRNRRRGRSAADRSKPPSRNSGRQSAPCSTR
jgi:methyl-accepting chemotaxis protein